MPNEFPTEADYRLCRELLNFRRPWCTEVHVASSLRSMGHTVLELQEDRLDWDQLPDLAALAHLVLWTRTWEVDKVAAVRALERLRDARIPSVSYHLDRWWGLDREYQVESEPFFRTDLVVSPDGANDHRWAEAGVNHLFLPPGVFAAECEPVAPNSRRFPEDVVFVGSHPYPHAEWRPVRSAVIDAFKDRFGRRFRVYPTARGRPIRGADLQEVYATAKVVLGDSCLAGGATHYWSDRIPETLGRGGLLIHPKVEGMDGWYTDGVDLLTYPQAEPSRAVELAERMLDDPAEADRISRHGRETVLDRDTYAHRMQSVIDHVEATIGLGRGPLAGAGTRPVSVRWKPQPKRVSASFVLAQRDPDNVAVWEVWQDDTYQLDQRTIAGRNVVDIGCNIGAFAVLAAKLGAQSVDAYEPMPNVMDVAVENVTRNRVADQVVLHGAAVGDATGDTTMADVPAGGAHVGNGEEIVPMVSINDVLTVHDEVGFLKIDCEGGEFDIVEAVDPELLQRVAHIAMEFHGPGMPHLTHLEGGPQWGRMVAKLAEYGRIRSVGHPSRGGLLWWDRY